MSIGIYELGTTAGTTASGYWAGNTNSIFAALLKHIYVDFGDTDVNFEFKLVDNKNRNIIYLNSCDTVLNREYDLPVKGIYTMIVSNATADATFKLRFACEDVSN